MSAEEKATGDTLDAHAKRHGLALFFKFHPGPMNAALREFVDEGAQVVMRQWDHALPEVFS